MKKLMYLVVVVMALGLVIAGCIPTVPPTGQDGLGILPNKNPGLNIPVAIDTKGRPHLVGTITTDGGLYYFQHPSDWTS